MPRFIDVEVDNTLSIPEGASLTVSRGGTPTYSLLSSELMAGSVAYGRWYLSHQTSHEGSLVYTSNAAWVGAPTNKWLKDVGGDAAYRLDYPKGSDTSSVRLSQVLQADGLGGTWADSVWNNTGAPGASVGYTELGWWLGRAFLRLQGPFDIPWTTAPLKNTLYASNIVKCWGNFSYAFATGLCTIHDGFNIDTVVRAANNITITFKTNMAAATYAVVYGGPSYDGAGLMFWPFTAFRAVGSFNVAFTKITADGTVADLATLDIKGCDSEGVSFAVFAAQ